MVVHTEFPFLHQLSDAAMAPNHQVSLSPEIPESSEQAVAQTEESLKSSVSASEATNATQPPKSLPSPSLQEQDLPYKWMNIILISIFHVVATYGLVALFLQGYWNSLIWMYGLGQIGGLGVTAGVHRLWTHRSYKAKLPLRIFLAFCFSLSGQNTIFEWVRDHRVHHKYSETDADPHNANRGFFFAHVGWLMMRKHPDVIEKGRKVDMSDVTSDPVVQFHLKHFWLLKIAICFIFPMVVPALCWGETWRLSFFCMTSRYMLGLNFTWLVNSAAHIWGHKPYDHKIMPSENRLVSMLALGEGWHNYHHVFPWDYKTSELGSYSFNVTTAVIDFFSLIGWAYDLKTVSPKLIQSRAKRTGDGSYHPPCGTVGGFNISEEEEPDDFLLPCKNKEE